MRCFVTVGSTEFEALVAAVDSAAFAAACGRHGVDAVVVQHGRGRAPSGAALRAAGVAVDAYDYKDALDEDIQAAQLVISHAGAGSILEALAERKALVVVVNSTLMHNHQTEVAEALAEQQHLVCTDPDRLVEALDQRQWSALQPCPPGCLRAVAAALDALAQPEAQSDPLRLVVRVGALAHLLLLAVLWGLMGHPVGATSLALALVSPVALVFCALPERMLQAGGPQAAVQPGRKLPVKTMVVLGSGGHTKEMLRIVGQLDRWMYRPLVYVLANTDQLSATKVRTHEEELMRSNSEYAEPTVKVIPRSREVRQSYVTSVFTTLRALAASVPLVVRTMPDVILCNGPGTCIPICAVAVVLRILCIKNIRIVFVESVARVTSMSLTGKLLYWVADLFVVQWAALAQRWPRVEFWGML